MTEETLRQLLARVHERLSSSGTVDPEARDMLATVMRDIDRALGNRSGGEAGGEGTGARGSAAAASGLLAGSAGAQGSGTAGSSSALDSQPILVGAKPDTPPLELVEALAVRFEAEHPAIAQLLRQIGTLLGQAGI
jgi:hypothetical protein